MTYQRRSRKRARSCISPSVNSHGYRHLFPRNVVDGRPPFYKSAFRFALYWRCWERSDFIGIRFPVLKFTVHVSSTVVVIVNSQFLRVHLCVVCSPVEAIGRIGSDETSYLYDREENYLRSESWFLCQLYTSLCRAVPTVEVAPYLLQHVFAVVEVHIWYIDIYIYIVVELYHTRRSNMDEELHKKNWNQPPTFVMSHL